MTNETFPPLRPAYSLARSRRLLVHHPARGADRKSMRQLSRRTGVSRIAIAVVLGVTIVAAGAGCGGSDDNRDEVRQLREELEALKDDATARELARLRGRITSQRRQIATLKRRLASRGGGSSGSSQPSASSGSASSGSTSCGEGLSVNSATSCSFARNVRDAYRNSGGAPEIDVYSPVTKRTYTMRCSGGGVTTVCTGGNNAVVYIR
jgi:hypothetical protein